MVDDPLRLAGTAGRSGQASPGAGQAFGAAAARLAGQTALLFGWSPDAFWRATPAELAALTEVAGAAGEPAIDVAALMERYPDE